MPNSNDELHMAESNPNEVEQSNEICSLTLYSPHVSSTFGLGLEVLISWLGLQNHSTNVLITRVFQQI